MENVYEQVTDSADFARWREAISDGAPERAIACARLMVHTFPEDPGAWSYLGSSFSDAGNDEGALTAYERAVELAEAVRGRKSDLRKQSSHGAGHSSDPIGEYEAAVNELCFSLHEAFTLQLALDGIGLIRLARGELRAARIAFEHSVKLYPHRLEPWRHLLSIYSEGANVRGEIRVYRAFIRHGEPSAENWNGLAQNLLRAGRARMAVKVCLAARRNDVGDGWTCLIMSRALAEMADAAVRVLDPAGSGQREFIFVPELFYREALRYCRLALNCGDVDADQALDLEFEVSRRFEVAEMVTPTNSDPADR